ncbi:MAG: ATP-binding protein [Ketobacteraceae bacterium]|nr:ATP-binding protein [Ketobacteraceae bacterium]
MFLFGNTQWLPSLKAQWVIGALVAMLPLMAAMIYGFNVMDHHNRAQRQLVIISASVAELGASISDQAKDMERVAKQFQVLKDSRLRQAFEQKQGDFAGLMARMKDVSGHRDIMNQYQRIQQLSEQIEQLLFVDAAEAQAVAERFKQLHETIQKMNHQATTWVQAELDALEASYVESQWHLLVMGFCALPAALLLVWLVSFMVLRPIYQLSAAIKRMGRGEWRTDIHISGSNEMVSLGDSLKWMQQQLLMLEAQKHTFLQQITHELKTPLAAIMEAGSLLDDEVPGKLNQSQRQVLGILQRNAGQLQGLIQQLLDYNSVVKDHSQQIKPVDLRSFCSEKLLDLQGLAETRNVKLVLLSRSASLVIDVVRVGMILRNLVSNAVQLTPPDKRVVVTWGVDQTTESWWLQVEDEGPGIQDKDMGRLFEPFYQGGAQRQGSLKGSGIGLAIVKECVDFLQGAIEVENLPGEGGACFTVSFPLITPQAPEELDTPARVVVPAGS